MTTYADSRVRPHSLGSVGKVRINARSTPPPNSRPGITLLSSLGEAKATLPPHSEFSIKFYFLRVTCAFTDRFFLSEQLHSRNVSIR